MPDSFYLAGYLSFAIFGLSLLVAVIHLATCVGYPSRRAVGGITLALGLVLLLGLRPLSPIYIDMTTYATVFERAKFGLEALTFNDPLFNLFTTAAAASISVSTYFLLCAALYVIPKAWACRILCGPRWPLPLAAMATSFSFYGFGTNGIRNGIAASIGLLALAWPRVGGKVLIGLASILTHASLALSMVSHAITWRFRSVRFWLVVWATSIPISFVLPKGAVLTIISIQEDSRTGYFDTLGGTDFRYDFIIYSAVGAAAIAYWKVHRKVEDTQFDHLASTYLLANAFWILINQIAFSNRFAYLSWFMLEVAVLLPLVRAPLKAKAVPVVLGIVVGNFVLASVIS